MSSTGLIDIKHLALNVVAALTAYFDLYLITSKIMAQVREIKCPHCGEWTLWNGGIDDRCLYCNGFLEPQRFSREVEKKVSRAILKESDYLFIKPGDGPVKREFKSVLNALRWGAYYLQIALFFFITMLLVLLSLLAA